MTEEIPSGRKVRCHSGPVDFLQPARTRFLLCRQLWCPPIPRAKSALGVTSEIWLSVFGGRRMIKVVYCVTKKSGCSDEEFFRYWKNVHGPIGARIPGLRRLVQSHRIAVPGDKRSPAYDGVAELWFNDVEALLAARQSPEWRASTEDEANFLDHGKVAYFVAQEHTIVDNTSSGRRRE
jgi:uncharacterized protein (TIGR02118 family)